MNERLPEELERDHEGFLLDAEAWTPEIAELVAEGEGIKLTSRHWEVVKASRTDFLESGRAPGMRRLLRVSAVPIKELYELFPVGPGKMVAKIAGLPKPTSCI